MNVLKSGLFGALAILVTSLPHASHAQDLGSAKRQMIQQSIQRYPGNCSCPYNRASNGSQCGGRSAWSRPGGRSPLCYADDISTSMVRSWMARNNMQVTRSIETQPDTSRETIRQAQAELNRLGCQLGTPDGVIGPMTRQALADFSRAAGIELRVENMRSQLFVRRLQNTTGVICR